MSLAVAGACQQLAVSTLCQLPPDFSGSICSNAFELKDSVILASAGRVFKTCKAPNAAEAPPPTVVKPDVLSMDLINAEHEIFLTLNQNGLVSAYLPSIGECLCDVVLNNDVHAGNLISFGELRCDIARRVLVLVRDGLVSLFSLADFSGGDIICEALSHHRFEQSNLQCSLWGTMDSFQLSCCFNSSDIYLVSMCRSFTGETEWMLKSGGAVAAEIHTKHEAWITALSRVITGCYSEISATGDCKGVVIIWILTPMSRINSAGGVGAAGGGAGGGRRGRAASMESAIDSETIPSIADGTPIPNTRKVSLREARNSTTHSVHPIQHVLRSGDLCEGNSISSILLVPALSDLWLADVTGGVTSAHLSIKSRALYPTRRLMLFGTLGGPSFLSWFPGTEQENWLPHEKSSRTNKDRNDFVSKPVHNGRLWAFSSSSGMLVECTIMNSVDAVFRLCASPTMKAEPQYLGRDHVGRVASGEVSALQGNNVDVCAYLPHWNMLAVTSKRSRFIQLWDLYSGTVQYTISTTESLCTCLSAFDTPVSAPGRTNSTSLLAVGYSSGTVVLYLLSRRCTTAEVVYTEPPKPNTELLTVKTKKNSRRESKTDSKQSMKSTARRASQASRASRAVSMQEVDILDAVESNQSRKISVEYGFAVDDDELSEASETSLGRDDMLGASDDDSVGGAVRGGDAQSGEGRRNSAAGWGGRRRRSSALASINSVDYRHGSVPQASGSMEHSIELHQQFCALPVTDIIFSTTGGFIVFVYIRKTIIVFNNHIDAKKMSLKLSFDDILQDIHAMVPSELTSDHDIDNDVSGQHRNYEKSNHTTEEIPRRGSDEKLFTFTDKFGRRHSVSSHASVTATATATFAATTSFDPPMSETNIASTAARSSAVPHTNLQDTDQDESLFLLLQSAEKIRLLDAIKGKVLGEFTLLTGDSKVVSCAAWDVPISSSFSAETEVRNSNVAHSTDDSVGGTSSKQTNRDANKSSKQRSIFGTTSGKGSIDRCSEKIIGSKNQLKSVNNVDNEKCNGSDRAVTGICVTEGMGIFLFGVDSEPFRQHYLHDQVPQLTGQLLSTSLHTDTGVSARHLDVLNSAIQLGLPSTSVLANDIAGSSSFCALDNMVQGVSIQDLSGFSPLACVWSLRRFVLLRVQLVSQRGVEVLRSEEYALSQGGVRIVFATSMKSAPRMRNHRAMVVLSNGHVFVLHF